MPASISIEGGKLTAERMIEDGQLKSGDKAMVYGVFSQAERGQSEKGLADTLEEAGLEVDRLEITQEANSDASLAVPVLAAYVQSHPDLKAIGTQHGGITGVLAEVLKKAGKKPGEITVGGIDLAPATIDGLKSGYVNVTLDQLLYLQGFLPVLQCVLTKAYKMPGMSREHRRRRDHAADDRRAGAADRGGDPLSTRQRDRARRSRPALSALPGGWRPSVKTSRAVTGAVGRQPDRTLPRHCGCVRPCAASRRGASTRTCCSRSAFTRGPASRSRSTSARTTSARP